MSDTFLYLTTRGRTSGLPRGIEIWFVEYQGRWYIVSEMREASGWVKNISNDPSVRFSVGTREARGASFAETAGRARVVEDEREPELARAVKACMKSKYDWSDGLVVEIERT